MGLGTQRAWERKAGKKKELASSMGLASVPRHLPLSHGPFSAEDSPGLPPVSGLTNHALCKQTVSQNYSFTFAPYVSIAVWVPEVT